MRVSSKSDARALAAQRGGRDHAPAGPPRRRAGAASSKAAASGGVGLDDPRALGPDAVGDRRLDLGRDPLEQRQRELHDLARHAVGVAQLLDLRALARRRGAAAARASGR